MRTHLVALVLCALAAVASASAANTFNAKPNGQMTTATAELDGVTCLFEFATVGGTNEKWEISLSKGGSEDRYRCVIERPNQPSYLYFTSFSAELKGATLAMSELIDSNGKYLEPSEALMNNSKLSSAPNKFKGSLSRVVLEGNRGGRDL